MTFQTIAFVFGCLLLLIGVVGGGFEVKELKLPSVPPGGRAASAVLGIAFVALAYLSPTGLPLGSTFKMSNMEFDTDRHNGDYDNFDTFKDDPQLCEDRCSKEARCRSWTYVKPNIQGVRAHCWLKETVPQPQHFSCCISGEKLAE